MQPLDTAKSDPHRRLLRLIYAGLALTVATLVAVVPLPVDDADAGAPATNQVWVADTQQVVAGPFLGAWLVTHTPERLGLPLSAATPLGDRWVQWFEYGRLEIAEISIEAASPEDVQLAPIGRRVAEKLGYEARLPEFQPVKGAARADLFFVETGHTLRLGFQRHYRHSGVAERLGLPISEEFSYGGAVYQYFEFGALTWQPDQDVQEVKLGMFDASLNGVLGGVQARPDGALLYRSNDMLALSAALPGERWIDIDVADFTLTAYVGDIPVLESTIVTGHEMAETPTGEFAIYLKYEQQDMSGIGWDGNPYFEAAVPWAMYFVEDFAIHGSTWRTEYGYQDSQGCVIPPNDVAELLYEWADFGTRVVVHD